MRYIRLDRKTTKAGKRDAIDFDALEEGNGVEFNVERGPRGHRAVNVRMIKA